ncbi:unnamed protein product [Leptosia nina]|uniref:Fibrillar collagen NC1 domain-containing protein n=1 Tax=Leptosia nina TaxID=320188 RepID=A0AAV1K0P5_9NEOP
MLIVRTFLLVYSAQYLNGDTGTEANTEATINQDENEFHEGRKITVEWDQCALRIIGSGLEWDGSVDSCTTECIGQDQKGYTYLQGEKEKKVKKPISDESRENLGPKLLSEDEPDSEEATNEAKPSNKEQSKTDKDKIEPGSTDYDNGPLDTLKIKGEPGLNGDKGDNGVIGSPGIQGPKGESGQKGDKGDSGTIGAMGSPGPLGVPGEKGEPGEKGDKGDAGLIGTKGDKGPPGFNGIGTQGEKGQKGEPGVFVVGPAGPPGPPGKDFERDLTGSESRDKNLGSEANPAKSCSDIDSRESGNYHLNPAKVFEAVCDFEEERVCIHPKTTDDKFYIIPSNTTWVGKTELNMEKFYDDMFPNIEYLRKITTFASQRIKINCKDAFRVIDGHKYLQMLLWSNVLIGPTPTDRTPVHYNIVHDTCDKPGGFAELEISTYGSQLPIIDMYLDTLTSSPRLSMELVELCFRD